MSTFNRLYGTFNLTRDPELRVTPKGASVLELGLASNHTSTDAGGVKHEEVWFGQAVAFGAQAETIHKWFRKGQPITLEGRLRTEQWDDKQSGQKRSSTRLLVEKFHFVPGYPYRKAAGGDPAKAADPAAAQAPAEKPAATAADDPGDDSIPY